LRVTSSRPPSEDDVAEVAARVRAGHRRSIGALIRDLEDDRPAARAALQLLLADVPRARLVGITGAAGAGKSTLLDGLVAYHRARGEAVAVVAVDPSSPFTGGAILGDRVRMQRHATDPGVFVRSLATRGASGGLARATWEAAAVLAAAGFPIIYVETTGAGQAEIAVARLADVVLVLCVPGMGDDVQALKAGILEIADILVVNKADREGADRTVQELQAMLALRADPDQVFVMKTTALSQTGLAELATTIAAQHERGSAQRPSRTAARARDLVLDTVASEARKEAELALAESPRWAAALVAVAERQSDPVALARALLDRRKDSDTLKG